MNELTADGLGWCVVVVVHILDMAAWSMSAAAADAAVRGGVVVDDCAGGRFGDDRDGDDVNRRIVGLDVDVVVGWLLVYSIGSILFTLETAAAEVGV